MTSSLRGFFIFFPLFYNKIIIDELKENHFSQLCFGVFVILLTCTLILFRLGDVDVSDCCDQVFHYVIPTLTRQI
jgi:hypothetical protein